MSTSENNKRIAKNTAFLYIRMFLTLLVTLYTSRVVLQVLGVVDFGIYNVVGGVVTMLSIFNSSLTVATQRFMNYEMGKGNKEALARVFSMSFYGFLIISLVTVVVAEVVGLWLINNQLSIPADRFDVAINVFHISIATFLINALMVPYNAAIIAHERMSIYAYVSVGEVVLKLLLVLLLQLVTYDKLVMYAIMMFVVTCLIALIYRFVCIRQFEECRLRLIWSNKLLKALFSFSGWMLLGTIAYMLSTQGVNMLINIFFGPAYNAARAISMQVNSAVSSFANNFMTAVRPQIVKSYAQGDITYMNRLVFSSSKLSFYLLFVLALPIIINVDGILPLWLGEVPPYASLFTQLVIVDLLINSTFGPIAYVAQASGKIKIYQIVVSICYLLIAFITWGVYCLAYEVEYAFIVAIVIDALGLFARLWVLQSTMQFPVKSYLIKVLGRILIVAFFAYFGIILSHHLFASVFDGLLIVRCAWCVLFASGVILILGLDKSEVQIIKLGINKVLKRK